MGAGFGENREALGPYMQDGGEVGRAKMSGGLLPTGQTFLSFAQGLYSLFVRPAIPSC